jgi:hypothetical protein
VLSDLAISVVRPKAADELTRLPVKTAVPFDVPLLEAPRKLFSFPEENGAEPAHAPLLELSLEAAPAAGREVDVPVIDSLRAVLQVVEGAVS